MQKIDDKYIYTRSRNIVKKLRCAEPKKKGFEKEVTPQTMLQDHQRKLKKKSWVLPLQMKSNDKKSSQYLTKPINLVYLRQQPPPARKKHWEGSLKENSISLLCSFSDKRFRVGYRIYFEVGLGSLSEVGPAPWLRLPGQKLSLSSLPLYPTLYTEK